MSHFYCGTIMYYPNFLGSNAPNAHVMLASLQPRLLYTQPFANAHLFPVLLEVPDRVVSSWISAIVMI